MYKSTGILMALVALAGTPVIEASPINTSPARQAIHGRADYCDGSSWENQTSLGSPLVADCLTLADRLGEHTFFFTAPGQMQIAQWGTCAFGIASAKQPRFGNDNARDLIRGSVQRYQWNGLVGAKGVTSCQWNGEMVDVEWGLYHD